MNVEVDFENKTTKVIVPTPWAGFEYHVTIGDEGIIVDAVKDGEVMDSDTYGYGDLSSYPPVPRPKRCQCGVCQECNWARRHE
jgi:hypothetical protein